MQVFVMAGVGSTIACARMNFFGSTPLREESSPIPALRFAVPRFWRTHSGELRKLSTGMIEETSIPRVTDRSRGILLIAFAALLWSTGGIGFEARGMAGNGMALVSSVFFAALILALRREHDAAESAITWGNAALALALLLVVAHDLALTPKSFAILLFLGVIQIAVAYVLFVR